MLYVQTVVVLSGLDIWAFVLTKLFYQLLSILSAKSVHIFNVLVFQVSQHSFTFLTVCKEDCCIFWRIMIYSSYLRKLPYLKQSWSPHINKQQDLDHKENQMQWDSYTPNGLQTCGLILQAKHNSHVRLLLQVLPLYTTALNT